MYFYGYYKIQTPCLICFGETLLYFRMLLAMVVSLYTSRVVLGELGVKDIVKTARKK